MQNSGHEIAAHTRTHPHLSTLTAAQQQDEIVGSLNDLQALGIMPVSFAYPYGDYNDTTLSIVANAGFLDARGTVRGFNDRSSNRLILKASMLGPQTIDTLNIVTQAIDDAQAKGTWLILVFHRIDETGLPFNVPHEFLQEIVDHLVQKNTKVVVTSEGVNIYGLQ
jgi:peptidoglycan/xylan/chitin deacetylase (PgdA/CDA1 family)